MNLPDSWLLYIGIFLILLSTILIFSKKQGYGILILFLAAFCIRLFMAHLDPFLYDWDEKYHALVARNMMTDPFSPMLKTEILIPYFKTNWCCNHIWLHKQPLFMWQMALSMKIFGVSEFAIRYPSVLMGALMVPLVFRICLLLTGNQLTSYGAALLMCCSHFQLQLTSGFEGMDHNDIAFGFYVLASIWAYAEYMNKRRLLWVILIGMFAGAAILNKWLTGLLVFTAWGVYILLNIRSKEHKREIIDLLISFCACLVVFLPWQLYIIHSFPEEAMHEYAYNAKHIADAVEGHTGHNEFYLNRFNRYFGDYIWVLVFAGFLFLVFDKRLHNRLNLSLAIYMCITYVFFSLVVQTKMIGYFFVAAPIGYIYMAISLAKISIIPKAGKILFVPVLLLSALHLLNLGEIRRQHDPDNIWRQNKIHNTEVYKQAYQYLPKDVDIVINLGTFSDVEFMFYNPGINAFHYCFTEVEMEQILKQGKKIAAFNNRHATRLNDCIKGYAGIHVIDIELKSTDKRQ